MICDTPAHKTPTHRASDTCYYRIAVGGGIRWVEEVEAAMASAASVAYLILAVFLGGITLGVVAMVAVAVRREDRLSRQSGLPPGELARGARRLTGFGREELSYTLRPPLISS